MWYRLSNFKLAVEQVKEKRPEQLDRNLRSYIIQYCGLAPDELRSYRIRGKSLDARGRRLNFVYNLDLDIVTERRLPDFLQPGTPKPRFNYPAGKRGEPLQPIVVGTGPAGLFAAYLLAQQGCCPVVIDRGQPVEQRQRDIERFYRQRQLNPDSNFLIGEGGAGTFSDGKLYTRIRDPRSQYVLDTFIRHGANADIAYLKRPHLGSDRLPQIVVNMRRTIIELGGSFMMGQRVRGIFAENGKCAGVILENGEKLHAPAVIIAHGLGDRRLTRQLIAAGIEFTMKPFQVGCRIEHPQDLIDRRQYRLTSRPAILEAAEYNLVSRPAPHRGIKSATTFCMCPGGAIIPGMAEPETLSTNGMSNYARDGKFANAAIIVSHAEHYLKSPDIAYDFLERLERASFCLGGGDYSAPAQSAAGFIADEPRLTTSESSYRLGLRAENIVQLLPRETSRAIKAALRYFDRKMPGFIKTGTLIGVETHVSSPVRFRRDNASMASSLPCLYIAGEGGGYAGGIISAAVDGLKIAEAICRCSIEKSCCFADGSKDY